VAVAAVVLLFLAVVLVAQELAVAVQVVPLGLLILVAAVVDPIMVLA
jgi:hypothetical protein